MFKIDGKTMFTMQITFVDDIEIHIAKRFLLQDNDLKKGFRQTKHHNWLVQPEGIAKVQYIFINFDFSFSPSFKKLT